MTWENLQEGILEEFVTAAVFTNEDTYQAWVEHLRILARIRAFNDAKYRERVTLDPVRLERRRAVARINSRRYRAKRKLDPVRAEARRASRRKVAKCS